jgi:hypothetical protein
VERKTLGFSGKDGVAPALVNVGTPQSAQWRARLYVAREHQVTDIVDGMAADIDPAEDHKGGAG